MCKDLLRENTSSDREGGGDGNEETKNTAKNAGYSKMQKKTSFSRRPLHDFIVDPLVLSLISFQVKSCFISFLVLFLLFHRPSPHSSFYSSLVSFHISDSEGLFLDSSSLHCVL